MLTKALLAVTWIFAAGMVQLSVFRNLELGTMTASLDKI